VWLRALVPRPDRLQLEPVPPVRAVLRLHPPNAFTWPVGRIEPLRDYTLEAAVAHHRLERVAVLERRRGVPARAGDVELLEQCTSLARGFAIVE
jgi:hypothetical protein